MINFTSIGVYDAKALLKAVADCGQTPPQTLVDIVDALDALRAAPSKSGDSTADLIEKVVGGGLRGAKLDAAIAEAAAAQRVTEFRAGLRQRAELPTMKRFVATLDEGGAADEIITAVTPAFDAAPGALVEIREKIGDADNVEAFLPAPTPTRSAPGRPSTSMSPSSPGLATWSPSSPRAATSSWSKFQAGPWPTMSGRSTGAR